MKSWYTQTLMLLCVLLAFAPILGVDYVLDGYIRAQETEHAQKTVDAVTRRAKNGVYKGIASIKSVIEESPSLCTPTFLNNVKGQMRRDTSLRQMLVENTDGVQYCDAFGQNVDYATLSHTLSIPGRSETVTVVKFDDAHVPLLKITHLVGSKLFSAFVYLGPLLADGEISVFDPLSALRISLANGQQVVTLGDYAAFEDRTDNLDFISVSALAGGIPLRTHAVAAFPDLRADYAELDVIFTIVACIISAGVLLLTFQLVRGPGVPSLDLESAIRAGELKPYYQPFIDLVTGRVLGCEVLVRWQRPNGEMVQPGAFIDFAEHSGLAIPMTISLMQQVREDLGELCADMPTLKVSINLFEGHFCDNTIIDDIQAIFGGSSIRFDQLVFEITERRPLTNNVQAYSVIAGMHALGARLAMDDVGTGHSNLAVIQTLGVDIIKIDRVFVDMIKDDTEQVPVLDGLLTMGKDLGAEIVAEGVETEAQALYLRAHGVTHAQGFLFAPALIPSSFVTLARTLNGETMRDPKSHETNIDALSAGQTNAA